MSALERISVEVTNRCVKRCAFCYSASAPDGETRWSVDELSGFARDVALHGVRAISFGGGEPLEFEGIYALLERTRGLLFRSMTTNGLLLDESLPRLAATGIEKVHVSVHFPGRAPEVARAVRQAHELAARGVASGVNLLVRRSALDDARRAAAALFAAGIGPERVVFLPMRGADTPTPAEVAWVAGEARFQSTTCLTACRASARFASISWDKRVAWCSYTTARATLREPTHAALTSALEGLGVTFCGDDAPDAGPTSRRTLPLAPPTAAAEASS